MALTYDVIQHTKNDNDAAVVFMVSGGWNSRWMNPTNFVNPFAPDGFKHFRKLVEAGYTFYIVRHGSAPRFKVPEAVEDVQRALRHIRYYAKDFTIDPNRIGVCGGSAGGHLSLMLGTRGDDGNEKSSDALERNSNRVAAVVAYFPPTDLRDYVGPSKDFPALDFDPELAESVSPLFHVTNDDAPTLLIHGTEDHLVPLTQSTNIEKAFKEKNVPSKLVVIEGAGHGFAGKDGRLASDELVAWFDKYLAKPEPKPASQTKRQRNYPPNMPDAKVETYKTVSGFDLNIHIFHPPKHEGNESRPAIVFFFGGGWKGGTPQQFEQQCRYLASRGMVAMTADYRVASRNGTKAKECVMDAKSAIRWIRENARKLGVDPDRIVAGGGSAGGHIAACTGTVEGFNEAGEDLSVSSRPNAMALFNPALVLAPYGGSGIDSEKLNSLRERMGVEPAELSPLHQLKAGIPPTIIFHGRADKTVPFASAEAFTRLATGHDDDVTLVGYADQPHGFFNYGREGNLFYESTMLSLDAFLVDRGLLEGPSPKQIKTKK